MRRRGLLPSLVLPAAGLAVGVWAMRPGDGAGAATVALCLLLGWVVADLLLAGVARSRASVAGQARPRVATVRTAGWSRLPPPRRGRPRPPVTVAAVLGLPELRPVGPFDGPTAPPERPIRIVAGPARRPDRALLTACWEVATRRSAALVDRVAVELGLARDPLRAAPAVEPDPLLHAATWARTRAA